jgi:hypothetical protein
MTTRTRMNVYFDPALIARGRSRPLALRRNVSKSAIVEAAVACPSCPATDREAGGGHVAPPGQARPPDRHARRRSRRARRDVSLFIHFWLTFTPPLPGSAQAIRPAPRARSGSRASCRRSAGVWRPATGSSKSLSRDLDSLPDDPLPDQSESDGDQEPEVFGPILFTADRRRSPHAA